MKQFHWSQLSIPAAIVIAWLAVNNLIPERHYESLTLQIRHAEAANLASRAEMLSQKQVETAPDNIDFHYQWITRYFHRFDAYHTREDDTPKYDRLTKYYDNLRFANDKATRDIGHYGIGLINLHLEQYQLAYEALIQISDKHQKYRNNTLGYVFLHGTTAHQDSLAAYYLNKELASNGHIEGAVTNLASLHTKKADWQELGVLIHTPGQMEWVPSRLARKYFLQTGKYVTYLIELAEAAWQGISLIEFIAALAVLTTWLAYLWKMDLFEPEPGRPVLLTLGFGMVMGLFGFVFLDINEMTLSFAWDKGTFQGYHWSDFFVGVLAEALKLAPLFYLIKYTKEVNESFDYLFYASLSGLGFSFIENLIFFSPYEIYHFAGSAVLNSVVHMGLTSITAYVLVLNRYRYRRHKVLRLLFFFVLACGAHMAFDLLQFYSSIGDDITSGFLVVFYFPILALWDSFKNNALNQSEFFTKEGQNSHKKLSNILTYGITGVILFEYLVMSLAYGPDAGNRSFLISAIGSFLLILLLANMGQFDLKKGVWFKLKWGFENVEGVDHVDFNEVVGKHIELRPFSNHSLAEQYLPNTGKVLSRESMHGDYSWYLVKLNARADVVGYKSDIVFVRPKETDEGIHTEGTILVGLYLIQETVRLESGTYNRGRMEFVHWAKAIQIDE